MITHFNYYAIILAHDEKMHFEAFPNGAVMQANIDCRHFLLKEKTKIEMFLSVKQPDIIPTSVQTRYVVINKQKMLLVLLFNLNEYKFLNVASF